MNIFDAAANKNLLQRLAQVNSESKPLWGKMSISQMVLHCQKPIDVAMGNLTLKGGLLGLLFGKMAKNNFLKSRGFSKSAPTHPYFRIYDEPDLDTEKEKLMTMVASFAEHGPAIIANKKHPFFGEMPDEEWGILMYIHLDHHLKQFGL